MALIIILTVAVVYALMRGRHDSYIPNGEWKQWAFLEGVFIDLVVVGLSVYAFCLSWYQIPGLALSFAFMFSIVFDRACGHFRVGNILYIGEYGWDAKVRRAIHYDTPFWGIQHPKALKYLLWKVFVGFIVIAGTISIIQNYG